MYLSLCLLHVHVHVHVHVCKYMYTYIVHVHVHVHLFRLFCTLSNRIHSSNYTYSECTHACMYMYIFVHVHVPSCFFLLKSFVLHGHSSNCMYMFSYMYMYMYSYMYMYMFSYMYMYMFSYMYMYMFSYMYMYMFSYMYMYIIMFLLYLLPHSLSFHSHIVTMKTRSAVAQQHTPARRPPAGPLRPLDVSRVQWPPETP